MNISPLHALLGFLLILGGVSGCTNRGDVALRQDDSNGLAEIAAESASVEQSAVDRSASIEQTAVDRSAPTQQPAVDPVESDRTPTALVSNTSTGVPAKPTLTTLPEGDDLSAQINDASGPVLLDFFAVWCGPCRIQSQILHDVEATAAESQTRIIKIDIDEHPRAAEEYQVSSLPTLMMVKDGEIVKRQSGVTKKDDLVAWMQ